MKIKLVKLLAMSCVLCITLLGCSQDSGNKPAPAKIVAQSPIQLLCEITSPAAMKGHEQLYIVNLLDNGKATIIARVLDFPFEGNVSKETIAGKRTDTVGDASMTETITLDRSTGILHRTLEKQTAGGNTYSEHYSKCAPLSGD